MKESICDRMLEYEKKERLSGKERPQHGDEIRFLSSAPMAPKRKDPIEKTVETVLLILKPDEFCIIIIQITNWR